MKNNYLLITTHNKVRKIVYLFKKISFLSGLVDSEIVFVSTYNLLPYISPFTYMNKPWPASGTSLIPFPGKYGHSLMIILARVSIVVKRHHDPDNSYKGKHLLWWLGYS